MTYPKLHFPNYTTILPTGETITFRPFTHREEQVLAMTTQDKSEPDAILNALSDIIARCTYNKLDAMKTPAINVEWLITQIRRQSKGDVIHLSIDLKKDGVEKTVKASVNLAEDIVVRGDMKNLTANIELGKNLNGEMQTLVLKQPSVESVMIPIIAKQKEDAQVDPLDMLAGCVDSLVIGETVHDKLTLEDKKALLGDVPGIYKEQYKAFFANLPKIVGIAKYKCPFSNDEIKEYEVEGIVNFFK